MTVSDFDRLWHHFSENLRRYVTARVTNPADAEDILQEAFLRYLERPPTHQNPVAWLVTVTRNLIADHHRRPQAVDAALETVPSRETAEVTETEQLVASWLEPMLLGLPAKYAEAVALADLHHHSMKQVAAVLGLSLPGAKSRVQRGRRLLAEALTTCCSFQFDGQGRVASWRRNHPAAACEAGPGCSDARACDG